MQKKDSYLFSLILVGCLFLGFCVLTHKGNPGNFPSGVIDDVCQQLYMVESSDGEIAANGEQADDLYNTITKRSNLLRGNVGCRNKGATLLFVLLMSICLWKQTSSFYFKINKKNNLDTFNVYETPIRRGPPFIMSIFV